MKQVQAFTSASKEKRLLSRNKAEALATEGGNSQYTYNVTRGFGSLKPSNIHGVGDVVAGVGDAVHSLFKGGEDILKGIGGDKTKLDELGGIVRTRESSLDAAGNIVGGIVTLPRHPIQGITKIARGGFAILDIPISAVADVNRAVFASGKRNYDLAA